MYLFFILIKIKEYKNLITVKRKHGTKNLKKEKTFLKIIQLRFEADMLPLFMSSVFLLSILNNFRKIKKLQK